MTVQQFIDATVGDLFVNVIFIRSKSKLLDGYYDSAEEARQAKIEIQDDYRHDGIKVRVKTFTLQEALDLGYDVKSLI